MGLCPLENAATSKVQIHRPLSIAGSKSWRLQLARQALSAIAVLPTGASMAADEIGRCVVSKAGKVSERTEIPADLGDKDPGILADRIRRCSEFIQAAASSSPLYPAGTCVAGTVDSSVLATHMYTNIGTSHVVEAMVIKQGDIRSMRLERMSFHYVRSDHCC